jgi:hypothetical protein
VLSEVVTAGAASGTIKWRISEYTRPSRPDSQPFDKPVALGRNRGGVLQAVELAHSLP